MQLDGLLAMRFWGFCFDSNITISDDWDPATSSSKGCKPNWPCDLVDVVTYVSVRSGIQNKAFSKGEIVITVAIRGGECREGKALMLGLLAIILRGSGPVHQGFQGAPPNFPVIFREVPSRLLHRLEFRHRTARRALRSQHPVLESTLRPFLGTT